jgi:hypothetical protein
LVLLLYCGNTARRQVKLLVVLVALLEVLQ